MAKFQVGSGLDEYIAQLENLEFTAPNAIASAVYEGAKVVADAVRQDLEALPTDTQYHNPKTALLPVEKQGLLDGLGVSAQKNENGYINSKIGFSGYNGDVTAKYPKGHPNAMIARALERGTSFMARNPTITKATKRVKDQAESAMAAAIDKEISHTVKE